jgi:3-phosphoshikimate 1-carboxyvinyltransferase
MQRALAAAFLTKETCGIFNPGHSNDDLTAMNIIKVLGAKVEMIADKLVVVNRDNIPQDIELNCGESGLSIRMFVPIAALSEQSITVTGEGSLLSRPMDFFDKVLPELGVKIESNYGKLPLKIKGPLQPRNIEVDGSMSSQYLTGLLMAYAAAGAGNVSIKVNNLKSKPYIDLTLDVMRHFGLGNVENRNYEEFYFHPATAKSSWHNYMVEGDWSSGAFLLVAGAIAGPIQVSGLDLTSTQADKAIVDVLMSANAGIAMEAKGIKIHPGNMDAFDFDATECPDLFPPLAALAVYCKGTTVIKGVERLVHKESNRALTIQTELGKRGIDVKFEGNRMMIVGKQNVPAAFVDSHNDHRIAMMNAVIGLKAEPPTILHNAHAVKKSYPAFFTDLKRLNADIEIKESIAEGLEDWES